MFYDTADRNDWNGCTMRNHNSLAKITIIILHQTPWRYLNKLTHFAKIIELHVCMCVCVYVCMRVYLMSVCMYVCVYVSMSVCMCVYFLCVGIDTVNSEKWQEFYGSLVLSTYIEDPPR